MNQPRLVVVAHGSRHPSTTDDLRKLIRQLEQRRADSRPTLGFLELSKPMLEDVVTDHGLHILVPLLLTPAFHATRDLPGRAQDLRTAGCRVEVGEILGADRGVVAAICAQAISPGLHDCDAYVLASPGTRHTDGFRMLERLADDVADVVGRPVRSAFATRQPAVTEVVARLRSVGHGKIGVLNGFFAAGLLIDRICSEARESGIGHIAETMAGQPALADVVLRSYDAALERSVVAG